MIEDIRDTLPRFRNPVKVIRAKCLDCCAGNKKEVKACETVKCPLHKWRFGKKSVPEGKNTGTARSSGRKIKEMEE